MKSRSFLRALVLLSMLALSSMTGFVAGAAIKKLKIDIFMETLSLKSIKLFTNSIGPAVQMKGFFELVDLNLYPFGNAVDKNGVITCQHGERECQGNRILACASDLLGNERHGTEFYVCFETSVYSDFTDMQAALENCGKSKAFNYSSLVIKSISQCANGDAAKKLMTKIAEKTNSLSPPHTKIPWILVNNVHDDDAQSRITQNIFAFACQTLGNPTSVEACAYFKNVNFLSSE